MAGGETPGISQAGNVAQPNASPSGSRHDAIRTGGLGANPGIAKPEIASTIANIHPLGRRVEIWEWMYSKIDKMTGVSWAYQQTLKSQADAWL